MKQFFLTIIVICTFFLTVASAYAGGKSEKKFMVYPNPIAKGALLTVEMPTTDDRVEITVILYNPVGKVIHTVKTTDKTVEFNAPEISGIYLLRLVEKQKVIAVEKIVVKE